MLYHQRKLFKACYAPRPFAYLVSRPQHYPEGSLSIEAQQDDGVLADPVQTIVASSFSNRPMFFALDASTRVGFTGER
jgi:hypothetical protein